MAQKLFIGGLPYSTSNERLREIFAECGTVESAVIVTDRETGRSRGFGFVEMATNEDAEAAIARYNGTDFEGRRLQVEKAKGEGASAGPRRGGGAGGGGFGRPASRGGRW